MANETAVIIDVVGDIITLTEPQDAGHALLRRPLHRLFVRGLAAEASFDGAREWRLPLFSETDDRVLALLSHFHRYGIGVAIGPGAKLHLESLQEQQAAFEQVAKKGIAAKQPDDPSEIMDQRELLGKDFVRALTDRQRKAVRHLVAVGSGANFSVPGAGKTSVAYAYYSHLRMHGIVDGLMVIGPASSFEPWEHEFAECFGREARAVRVAGNPRSDRREILLTASRFELVLTTYHSAANDLDEMRVSLKSRPYLLVLDESHYVKRPSGGKLADAVLELAPSAQRRLILTGTPMPNGLSDLWSQLTFLWPGKEVLGPVDDYLSKVTAEDQAPAIAEVRNRVYPFFFRTTKHELGLQPPRFEVVPVALSPLQSRIYRGVAARFLTLLDEAPSDRDALRAWRRARAIRLLQVATNPTLLRRWSEEFRLPPLSFDGVTLEQIIDQYADYEIPSKLHEATELASMLVATGRKVLIWSAFVHNLEMISRMLNELSPVVVHGAVPVSADDSSDFSREKLIARFRDDPTCTVMIANPAACAESISLHRSCHDAIYVDRTFNCAHYLQSLDRIHRLGLPPGTVTTYYLLRSSGTIDEIVHQRLAEKEQAMRAVVEGELPIGVPGYWGAATDDVEDADLDDVESHIRAITEDAER